MRQGNMLNVIHEGNHSAEDPACRIIQDKIDFLVEASKVATGVDQIEPLLSDLLDRILRSLRCRSCISSRLTRLLEVVDGDNVSIIQFCMHVLRWEEVQGKALTLLERESSVNRRRLYGRVLESFSDDWPERDIYDKFSSE